MTISKEWDIAYKKNTNLSVWPWSDLISYVKRYSTLTKTSTVLELGCGAGANIPFFLSLGVKYYSIDGSKNIISKLKRKFPLIKDNLIVGDFTKEIPFSKSFDLIIDRSSLTHNSTSSIMECLENTYKKLKIDGKFIGIDWFSTSHMEFKKGGKFVDRFTKNNFRHGQFQNIGLVHFSNKSHLENLFSKFEFIVMEEKIVKKEIPKQEIFSSWNFVAKKSL